VDDFSFGELILTLVVVYFLLAFLMILLAAIGDIYRDRELSGWGKAAWLIVLVLFPFVGLLLYLISRGPQMAERAWERPVDYPPATPASEIARGKELLERSAPRSTTP
jgi:hypothetical protein